MTQAIQLTIPDTRKLPALFTPTPAAAKKFVAFFTANIRNPNTRKAYTWAVAEFATWCERHGLLSLPAIEPVHVATYIETLQRRLAAPSVKQHLAAIRMLFDWLVVGQVIPTNPASSVRGPKYSIKKGKTPLFRTMRGRTGQLSDQPMTQPDAYRMIRRRATAVGIRTKIGNHSFRATGITEYLRNGGKLEIAQQMANHESARTTGLYDRRADQVSLDEVERIVI